MSYETDKIKKVSMKHYLLHSALQILGHDQKTLLNEQLEIQDVESDSQGERSVL